MATAALLLAGCSVYRDVTGASKNDPPPDARNTQNLEAASGRPFPNLASVPPAPNRALTTAEREALQKGLLADRANARYADEELRAGTGAAAARPVPRPAPAPEQTASAPAAPPAPAETRPPPAPPAASPATPPSMPTAEAPSAPRPAPASPPVAATPVPPPVAAPPASPPAAAPPAPQVAARPPEPAPAPPPAQVQQQELPRESPLTPPEVRSTPQPETPAPAPPRPTVAPLPPPPGVPAAPAPPAAAPAPIARTPVVIAFAEGSAAVPGADRPRLDGLAAAARQGGGTVRIVSQATPATGGTMGQLAAFGLALDRANAVAQVLTAAGVPSERILVEAAPPADRPGRAEVSLAN